MKFKKPEVGQLVFVRDAGYRFRNSKDSEAYPVRVKKVGRKYFTLEHRYNRLLDGDRFHLDTWRHENGVRSESAICYPTIKHHLEMLEYLKLAQFVSNSFPIAIMNKYTLDQLRRIADIIKEGVVDD